MLIRSIILLAVALFAVSGCDKGETPKATAKTTGAEEKQPAEKEPATEAPPVAPAPRPEPVIVESGNSFEQVFTSGSAQYQTGNDYTTRYTVVDYTRHAAFDQLPIDEFSGPRDEEQMVRVRVEMQVTHLRGLKCKAPADGFSLYLTEGGERVQKFTRFDKAFQETYRPTCLALDEKQTVDVWFKLPGDADLSNAIFSLYTGSDSEPLQVKLNQD